jgi:hypothetical protein
MCLVIDTCCIAAVFDGTNAEHHKFEPIVKWIEGRGRMICGGSKYDRELAKMKKYLPIILELSKARKLIRVPSAKVDKIARELKTKCPAAEFNDEHIAAIVIASGCGVVCTDDEKAIKYLKMNSLFRNYKRPAPNIYRGDPRHRSLCCDRKVIGICKN